MALLLYNSDMHKTFVYTHNGQDYPVNITYKRIKNIHFRFINNAFEVSCNRLTLISSIKSGLDKYADKLIKRSCKTQAIGEDFIYLLGLKNPLKYPGAISFLNELIIYDTIDELLKKLRKPFLKYLANRTEEYAKKMNAPLYKVKVREMRSRYGSNNRRAKTITYAMMLIHYSLEIVDSVIIHELTHCFVYDHSDKFYRLLYKYCPDYDKLRKKLIKAEFK